MPYHPPEDVLFKEILPKLPVRSLCRFKCVSKSWLARISGDPTFVADHLDHHSNTTGEPNIIARSRSSDGMKVTSKLFLLEDDYAEPVETFDISYIKQARKKSTCGDNFTIIGCCNGLVCLRILFNDTDSLVFWNPATREFRYLPNPTIKYSKPRVLIRYEAAIDMGFDEDGNDYKIVRLVKIVSEVDEQVLVVQRFAKSSGSWRQLQVIAGCEVRGSLKGLQIDGALLWPFLPYNETVPAIGGFCRILSFDLRSEEIREMKGPVWTSTDKYDDLVLTKRMGSLGAFLSTRETDQCEFWLRTRNIDKNDIHNYYWTKMFNIHNLSMPCWSFRSRIRDKFICFKYYNTQNVFMFDPFTQKLTEFDEEVGRVFDGFDYCQSLVSPH